MLIRAEQMEAFDSAAVKLFEDRTYVHLQEWFPHHCRLLDEQQVRRLIRHGWKKATSYGFTAECCVRSYIENMCRLGGAYDTDLLLPWAAVILNEKPSPNQVERADRLYHKMWDYIDHVARDYRDAAGEPTTARFMNDLRELRHRDEELVSPPLLPEFLASVEARFERLFPAKCSYVGNKNVRRAVAVAVDDAAAYRITCRRGATLFASLRFVLGGGFDSDLLFPWASQILNDDAIVSQHDKVDKLYAAAVSLLRRWWDLSSAAGEVPNVLG